MPEPEKKSTAARIKKAMTRRQKAIAKMCTSLRSFMNTAIVPKSAPANSPSKRALFLVNFDSSLRAQNLLPTGYALGIRNYSRFVFKCPMLF